MTLRVNSAQVKKDVEAGIAGADATKAGEQAGGTFASGFGSKAKAATTSAVSSLAKIGLGAAVGVAAVSLKMAAGFQSGLTTLVTGAGEAEKNLKMVGNGILGVASATGTSTKQLIAGMYMIESAGFHGAAALDVLKASAQGAKVGNADLAVVANAVTTVMKDYGKAAGTATQTTDGLVAVVSLGKTHLQDLASSMARILPTASALHLSFADVGGAMATMTAEGTSARLAAMGLNATILAMAAPTHAGSKAMAALGLSSKTVADTLTHKGLVAALTLVQQAALKAGPEGSAPFVQAMKAMLGGTNGLRVGLQLTGSHMSTLIANTKAVGVATGSTAKDVTGWALVQKDANQQMDILKARVEVAGITIGQKLLPALSSFLGYMTKTHLIIPVVIGVVGLLTAAIVAQGIIMAVQAGTAVAGFVKMAAGAVAWAAVQSASLIETAALWVMYTFGVEAAGLATIIATGGIILVIGLVIAAAYLLWKNWGTVWGFCKAVVVDLWHWLQGQWQQLTHIIWDPIHTAVLNIISEWNAITAGVKAVFDWIGYNWHLVFIILTGPIALAVLAIELHWKAIQDGLHAVLNWVTSIWATVNKWLEVPVHLAINLVLGYYTLMWNSIKTIWSWFQTGWSLVKGYLSAPVLMAWGLISGYYTLLWNGIKAIWSWFNTGWSLVRGYLTAPVLAAVNILKGYWTTILRDVTALGNNIKSAYANTIGWLITAGKNLITGLFNGALSEVSGAASWAANIGGKIVNAVKGFFGIHSPSTVFASIGGNLMAGLVGGMISSNPTAIIGKVFGSMPNALMALMGKGLVDVANLPAKALSALGSLLGSVFGGGATSGVKQWTNDVLLALKMLGLPASDLGFVLNQMSSESGGNTQAVNRTDINWQQGHPSVGLMQVIKGTYDAWAGPFLNTGPFMYGVSTNALANIYAALNYGKHGAGFGTGAGQIGSMHGYARGGVITEPITGVGRSGQRYSFGENGPETVTPGLGGGAEALLSRLLDVMSSNASDTAQGVADALNGVAHTAVYAGSHWTG
jgi:TP901 family phage tail tape measure protein